MAVLKFFANYDLSSFDMSTRSSCFRGHVFFRDTTGSDITHHDFVYGILIKYLVSKSRRSILLASKTDVCGTLTLLAVCRYFCFSNIFSDAYYYYSHDLNCNCTKADPF